MFDKKTVVVVGAGAGFDIEMPLGDGLAERIASAVNFYFERGELTRGDARIATALERLRGGGLGPFVSAGRMIAEGIKYSRSIDNYVHSHSDKEAVKIVAKMAIAQTILDAENNCHIAINPQEHPLRFRDETRAHRSWLSDFFTVLQDGIIEAKNLDGIFNNLTIINFNYDRCIEHYLFHVMQRLYPTKGEGTLTELLNHRLKIVHPYGVVGNLPWQSRTDTVHFGGGSGQYDLAALSDHIRTYNEEVDDQKTIVDIRTALAEAQRIVFLGFHFHKQNVELLAPNEDDDRLIGSALILATQIGRSPADIDIIENRRLARILHGRSMDGASEHHPTRDCKALFRDFGGVLAG